MGADNQSENLQAYSWPELLKRPRREMLVDELLFTTGVTTLVAPSGDGKTTLALSLAMTVATGNAWGGKLIKRRPVVWIAGEGQDDLRPMYEAWVKEHPDCGVPEGCFLEEPINLSSDSETDKLITLLEGMPPALIVTDALADMIGDLNEDKSQDINRVYRNIWRVVRKNNGCFLIPHHAGWAKDRERGSTAIRAKSDIVAQIAEFDPADGFVKLKHHKRRGGAKLEQFFYEARLIPVSGYPQPIPIVTGVTKTEADGILNGHPSETERHAQELVRVVLEHFSEQGATYSQLLERSGMKPSKFNYARNCATKEKGWLVGGRGRGARYKLNSDDCWRAAIVGRGDTLSITSLPSLHPYRGVEVKQSDQVTSIEASSKLVRSESDSGMAKGETAAEPSKVGIDPLGKAAELLKKAEV